MKGVNQAVVIGTLGRDPETKTFQNGGSIATFSVAVNESWKDKNTGEKKEHTEWINIVANGKLAEICSTYLRKGSKVYICGKIKTRKYQAQDGNDRYTTEIHANYMQMLDERKDSGQSQAYQQPQRSQAPARQGRTDSFDDFDDSSITF